MFPELERQCVIEEAGVDTVHSVVSEVLETMFFSEAEPAGCEHAWLVSAPCAWVRFEGSHCGEMQLAASMDAADAIAAGFLGLDPVELTEPVRGQVLEELANILCGALLSQLWPESKLALASPKLTVWQEWTSPEWTRPEWLSQGAPGQAVLHRCFLLPEGMLAISIRLSSRPGQEGASRLQ